MLKIYKAIVSVLGEFQNLPCRSQIGKLKNCWIPDNIFISYEHEVSTGGIKTKFLI
jgi:hypothetical protein